MAVSDDDDDILEGGLLTLREKSKDELEQEEEEYRAYLEREVGDIEGLIRTTSNRAEGDTPHESTNDNEQKLEKTSKKRKDRSENSDEQFLMKCVQMACKVNYPVDAH